MGIDTSGGDLGVRTGCEGNKRQGRPDVEDTGDKGDILWASQVS